MTLLGGTVKHWPYWNSLPTCTTLWLNYTSCPLGGIESPNSTLVIMFEHSDRRPKLFDHEVNGNPSRLIIHRVKAISSQPISVVNIWSQNWFNKVIFWPALTAKTVRPFVDCIDEILDLWFYRIIVDYACTNSWCFKVDFPEDPLNFS